MPGNFAMAASKIQISPELVAEGKRLYEETLTPVAVAALKKWRGFWGGSEGALGIEPAARHTLCNYAESLSCMCAMP